MGLLSSSKSTTQQTTNNLTTNQDNRIAVTVDGGGHAVYGNTGTVTFQSMDGALAGSAVNAGGAALIAAGGVLGETASLMRTISGDNAKTVAQISSDGLEAQRLYYETTRNMADDYATATRIAQTDAYNFSSRSLDNTLNFGRDALSRADDQTSTAMQAIRQTSSTLLDFINTNIKPADQQAFQAVIPWLVGGAVIIGVFAFGSRAR